MVVRFSKSIKLSTGLAACLLLFTVLLAGCVKGQQNAKGGVDSGMIHTAAAVSGDSYYVDSDGGNDNNDGKSEAHPWQTLEKLNTTVFGPGDAIFLKSGSSFAGQLKPIASGAPGQPIILTSYGGSQKPLIAGGGVQPATIYLYNLEHWEISNIEITNYNEVVNVRSGVLVENDEGLRSHIYLRNLEIHNVNGENVNSNWGYDRTNGGIVFYMKGYGKPAYMDDVLIEGNYIHNADRSGIYFYSSWCNRNAITEGFGKWTGSTNVVVRNNVLNDIGGDGIVLVATDGGLVEHNVATYTNARSGKNNIAIWCGNSDNCVIQFNEAAYTQVMEGDGEGFDIDFGGENNILQYNYSHDNEGGFVLVTSWHAIFNKNAIVRYNISQNDRQKVFRIVGTRTTGAQIYNNTVYIGPHLNTKITETDGGEGEVGEALFANNLIINHGTGTYLRTPGAKFSNNCFYATKTRNGEPDDPFKITDNPLVVNEGSGGTGIDSVDGYKLQADSPCIDAGKTIEDNGGKDYFGNAVPQSGKPDIGAHEYVGLNDGTQQDTDADKDTGLDMNTDADLGAVSRIDGANVTVQEFKAALERHRSAVFSRYSAEHQGEDFWTSDLSDGKPVDVLFRQALDECADYHVKLRLAVEAGIIKDAGYQGFLEALREENKKRKEKAAAGEVIYGPEQYTEATYFPYYFLELVRLLKEKHGEEQYQALLDNGKEKVVVNTMSLFESLKADYT